MELALAQARLGMEKGEVPVGAVVVREGVVLCACHNIRGSDPTAHAEVLAIRGACKALGRPTLNDCTVYVTLEPCAMCTGALITARIGRIVFGAFDEKMGCCGSVYALQSDPALRANIPTVGGVLEEACARLLSEYFVSRRA